MCYNPFGTCKTWRYKRRIETKRRSPFAAPPGAGWAMPSIRAVVCKRGDSSGWSNSDVLRWLIDEDQKQFIPAFLQHNVTGAQLKRMLSSKDHADDLASTPLGVIASSNSAGSRQG